MTLASPAGVPEDRDSATPESTHTAGEPLDRVARGTVPKRSA